MAETPKTLIFIGAAVVVAGLAFALRPAAMVVPQQGIGDKLFSEMKDATSAASLEIVRYDSESDEPVRLKINRDGGDWVIASHNDYPANAKDASDRIRDAALRIMDLEILRVATELPSEHGLYGVIAPDADKMKEANKGDVGMLVSMQDANGRNLAQLIVGKTVEGDASQRFVRKAGDNHVYTAKIDVEPLSSKFENWIESDLLGIQSDDISQLLLKDYNLDLREVELPSGEVGRAVDYDLRLEVKLDVEQQPPGWKLAELLEFRSGKLVPSKLTEDEELNTQKLDEMREALAGLKIVGVEKMSPGLAPGSREQAEELGEKGFFAATRGNNFEVLSNNGEVHLKTKEGIDYVLRFGRTAGAEVGAEDAKLNRYLLVSAKLDEAAFAAPPVATPLPNIPSPGLPGDEGPQGEAAEANPAEATPPAAEVPAEKQDEPQNDTPASAEEAATESAPPVEKPAIEPPPGDAAGDAAAAEAALVALRRKEAEEKVKSLNERFGNWFYVIPEDVYQKIHLGKFDIIKAKESSFGLDELRDIDDAGPERNPLPPLE